MRAELESKELLTFCVKKVKGLSKVKLVDAGFIWTEPHSRRLKLKLTIQAEVLNGAILQQTFVVEVRSRRRGARRRSAACGTARRLTRRPPRAAPQFVVEPHMCEQCQRSNTNSEVWTACVQARSPARRRSGAQRKQPYVQGGALRARQAHAAPPVTQIRQKVEHKRTFLFLEQLILKVGSPRVARPARS